MNLTDLYAGIIERDQWRCVRCGTLLAGGPKSTHHRVLGNRSKNTAWNLITLCGTGNTGCHGWVHGNSRAAKDEGGWIVSRHAPHPWLIPVYYSQPGREGWFLLNDDLSLTTWETPS